MPKKKNKIKKQQQGKANYAQTLLIPTTALFNNQPPPPAITISRGVSSTPNQRSRSHHQINSSFTLWLWLWLWLSHSNTEFDVSLSASWQGHEYASTYVAMDPTLSGLLKGGKGSFVLLRKRNKWKIERYPPSHL